MFASAAARQEERTVDVATIDEAVEAAQSGFAVLPYEGVGETGEDALNAKGVSVRCLQTADGGLPLERDLPGTLAYVARAY
jgi:prolyl-tRNA synthetase